MADTKTSELSTITGANTAVGDKFLILDVSDTTQGAGGTLKAMTRTELAAALEAEGLGVFKYAIVSEQQSAGTDGGDFDSGAWRTRALNIEDYDPDGLVSLSSSQITFAEAGTYKIEAWGMAFNVVNHSMRFYDVTNTTTTIIGDTNYARAGTSGDSNKAHLVGFVTVSASDVYELQHQCSTSQSGNGFGEGSSNTWQVCKYAQVLITKIS